MKRFALFAASTVLAATLVAACDDDDDTPDATETATSAGRTATNATSSPDITGTPVNDDELIVELEPLNGSNVTGTATLTEGLVPDSTAIIVMIDDTEGLGVVGLHAGTCEDHDEEPINELGDLSEDEGSTADTGLQVELSGTPMSDLRGDDYVIVVMDAEGTEAQACGAIDSANPA